MDFKISPLRILKCMPHLSQTKVDNVYLTDISNECTIRNSHHSSPGYVAKVLVNLNMLRLSKRFCDVEIIVEDKPFVAHRAVLAASSPYFQAMFAGGLCEEGQRSVELHGIASHIFDILLTFIYSGDVNITQSNVQELMIAADMVGLAEIVAGCSDFLTAELHPLNAIGIYGFADDHNWMELRAAAMRFIEDNFPKVSKEDELYGLSKDGIIKFLSSEYIKIDSEFQVFQCALRWINEDIRDRRQYVFDILKYVRLPLLSNELLENSIAQCHDSSLKIALRSVHMDLVHRKGCLVPLNTQPRKCAKKDIYVIGGSKRELQSVWDRGLEMNYVSVERFNTFTRQWHKVPDMTVNRLVPGVAAINGHIYVVGGEQDSAILSSCERYDPETNRWAPVSNMVVSRCEFGLCTLDGHLYAMGGWVDTDISGSIERYDPKLDAWRLVGALPEPRFSMGLVSYEGLVYMVGGCSLSKRNLQDLSSYDPFTGEWRKLPPMSVARFQMGVAVLDDFLYVVGGTNRQQVLSSVERYSFRTRRWSTVPPMSVERSGPAVAAMDGLLYVIGGAQTHATPFYRAQCTIASVESFDPITNAWSSCPPLSETRAEAGAVVI